MAVNTYLAFDESTLLRQQAAQSSFPQHACHRPVDFARFQSSEPGTSRLPQRSDFTSMDSLPGLTSGPSLGTEESLASSMGLRAVKHSFRAVTEDGMVMIRPPLRTDPPVLECPFDLLGCRQLFHVTHGAEWRAHSLTHFRADGRRPRNFAPPCENRCCFCDMHFDDRNGFESWRKRMDHVASHHGIGHSLSHARPDFALYEYLWQKKLIENHEYNHIKSDSEDRSRMVHGNPSPPLSEKGPASQDPSESRPYTLTNERRRGERRHGRMRE